MGHELGFGQIRLRLRPGEDFVFYATYFAGEYDPLDLREGDVVLDAGANVGDYTILASKRVGPEGTVVAIEPDPEVIPYLEWNVRRNSCSNVKIVECALGSPGQAELIRQADGGSVGSYLSRTGTGVKVRVRSISEVLSSFGLTSADVVKMDIEGAEYEALSGFHELSRVRSLAVELHEHDNLRGVPPLLEAQFHTWYATKAQIWRRSVQHITRHPIDFLTAEIRSKFVALRGVTSAVARRGHPVPSVDSSELAIIYGRNKGDAGAPGSPDRESPVMSAR